MSSSLDVLPAILPEIPKLNFQAPLSCHVERSETSLIHVRSWLARIKPRSFAHAQDDRRDGSWSLELFESRLDYNRRPLIDHFEQFDHVLVTHPHAAVTRSRADFVLVFGAMNVDEAVARIRIVLVQSVEPQNARRDPVLRRRKRCVGLKRNAAYKNWFLSASRFRSSPPRENGRSAF